MVARPCSRARLGRDTEVGDRVSSWLDDGSNNS